MAHLKGPSQRRLEILGSTRLEDGADRAEERFGGSELWEQRRRRGSADGAAGLPAGDP
ncbi:hypothetical protein ABZW11_07305 [Nonomuraea sp. NPDC004580]|uniref:hypothetical protein n=1 Tax=Nonomuraea sp. NPDC004580 TaxID=3154552 RepID=UPI0033B86CC1